MKQQRAKKLFMVVLVGVLSCKICVLKLKRTDTDPEMMEDARSGIPVTRQRRFDVYPDVSMKGEK